MTLGKNPLNRESCDFTKKFEKKIEKKKKNLSNFCFIFFLRGSVFNMKFRVLSREFESIETSPGFAQFLGENWI